MTKTLKFRWVLNELKTASYSLWFSSKLHVLEESMNTANSDTHFADETLHSGKMVTSYLWLTQTVAQLGGKHTGGTS